MKSVVWIDFAVGLTVTSLFGKSPAPFQVVCPRTFIIASGEKMVFQFCRSFFEIFRSGADPSKSQALADLDDELF